MEILNTIHLCGGLGNQLFQYAFGRVQKEAGVMVRYNPTWYKKTQVPPRPYRLDKFCVDIKISPFFSRVVVKERGFDMNYLKKKNCNFIGYWQYLDYYKGIMPILQKEFCIRKELYTTEFSALKKKILETPSVSVHVRRQDYVGRNGFGALPLAYYFKALSMVEGAVYIFSDDIEWCEDNFKSTYFSRKITFVHLKDYLDFELMRSCTHHICANSTFSWWAAILDDNIKKTVITPSRWLMNSGEYIDEEIKLHYPKHWIKL